MQDPNGAPATYPLDAAPANTEVLLTGEIGTVGLVHEIFAHFNTRHHAWHGTFEEKISRPFHWRPVPEAKS